MSEITPIPLPTPIDWNTKKAAAEAHIGELEQLLDNPLNLRLYLDALSQVCAEQRIQSRSKTASYWLPYLHRERNLIDFFMEWLTFTPPPATPSTPGGPGQYIEYWDYFVNTDSGLILVNDTDFKPWFSEFLNFHGDWINSTSSTATLSEWMQYKGTTAHPFDINDYEVPTGGFASFNQFFLRNLKGGQRPLCTAGPTADVISAPCDGGVFYLTRGNTIGNAVDNMNKTYDLPGKSDRFNLLQAVPGYGRYLQGGPLLDILLWFTDYHHFHAPVSGKVIDQGLYEGSYNYDFGDYDPKDHYAPNRPKDSDRVGWYEELGKHQRYVWVIQTENLGLVAMIAIGFWGVGSIENTIKTNAMIEKGQYMGHFGYGGSSIVLAFEPGMDLQFKVGNQPVEDPDLSLIHI